MISEDFYETIRSPTNIYMFLLNNGLKPKILCPVCSKEVLINIETLSYRCQRNFLTGKCNFKKTVLLESLMLKKRLCIKKYLTLVFEWSRSEIPILVATDLGISKSTVTRVYAKLNQVATTLIKRQNPEKLGGWGKIVEIDESKFVKRKYNKGRILSGEDWIVGGVERGNWNKFFIEFVTDRRSETLAEIIERNVNPESIIYTDEWPAYKGALIILSAYDFVHDTVCHKENYVKPGTNVHTQNVEGFWSLIKRNLRKEGTRNGNSDDILAKIHGKLFKKCHGSRTFEVLISELLQG